MSPNEPLRTPPPPPKAPLHCPLSQGMFAQRRLEQLRDQVLYPALGLTSPDVPGVYLQPRQQYDTVLALHDAPAARLEAHLSARRRSGLPSVLVQSPHYAPEGAPLACSVCRLHAMLRPPHTPPGASDGLVGGSNLRLGNAALTGSDVGWFDAVVPGLKTLGSKVAKVTNVCGHPPHFSPKGGHVAPLPQSGHC